MSKRPPPPAPHQQKTKRARVLSDSPSPSPSLSPLPDEPAVLPPPPPNQTADKFLPGSTVSSVAGTRMGDGSGFDPTTVAPGGGALQLDAEGTGPGPVKVEVSEAEEKQIVEDASKGIPVDDAELGDAKETSRALRPAVLEEKADIIRFVVVANDGAPASMILLTGLKCLFQKQLPMMPKEYIARLVYDRNHRSLAIVKRGLKVVGGICYRPFESRSFAEIVFCAVASSEQVKGYGSHLMNHLKDHIKESWPTINHFLTYADNYAIGYFKKQGFTKEISLDRAKWVGYIKDYEGGTIMQCTMLPKVVYLDVHDLLAKQKDLILNKIRQISKSHVVHAGLPAFRRSSPPPRAPRPPKPKPADPVPMGGDDDVQIIDDPSQKPLDASEEDEEEPPGEEWWVQPGDVPGLKESGWTREMDEISRRPLRGPQHSIMVHVLSDMQNSASAWPFAKPVNKDEVLDYYIVITQPMDLSTMEYKLDSNLYPTLDDFIADASLIYNNCRAYNPPDSTYVKNANKLEKYMKERVRHWLG